MADRVVFLTSGIREYGGIATRSRLLIAGLVDEGWEVRVVGRAGTRYSSGLVREEGFIALELPGFGRPRLGGLIYLIVGIPLALIWSLRARAIVAMQLSSPSLVAGVTSLVTRVPYVAMTTSTGPLSEVDYVTAGPGAAVRRALLRRAAVLFAQTSVGAEELERASFGPPVEVLPTPVEELDPPPLSGEPRVLFSGRFSEEKDLPTLLAAWSRLVRDDPRASLTLVGAGGGFRTVETEIRSAVALDPRLASTVSFTGWVSDVAPYLRTADVYVFPSRSEGMSNSLLEACAWGRVIVASDILSNVAVLGEDYPLLFRAGDSVSLQRTLERALTEDAVREEAREHALVAAARSSKSSVVRRLDRYLRDVARRSRHQHP